MDGSYFEYGTMDSNTTIKLQAQWGHKLINQITPEDYGKPINYTTTFNGVELNEWKLLYKSDYSIYLILSDYLPADAVPSNLDLIMNGPIAYKNTNTSFNNFKSALTNYKWNWLTDTLAFGEGSYQYPTAYDLITSYNQKYNTNYSTTDSLGDVRFLSSDGQKIDTLYIPHTNIKSGCARLLAKLKEYKHHRPPLGSEC